MWSPDSIVRRVAELRSLGAKRVCFKTGPFDPRDIATTIEIASESGVDLVTLDGAGGGTGHSPKKMMNEWGRPTVTLEVLACRVLDGLAKAGKPLPPVAMAAASVGREVGEALKSGSVPREYARFGSCIDEIFADLRILKAECGGVADSIPTGALGLYSYLNGVCVGLKQFMALNRKFALQHISREDIVPLPESSAKATGLATYDELLGMKTDTPVAEHWDTGRRLPATDEIGVRRYPQQCRAIVRHDWQAISISSIRHRGTT
jgi:hypothetical protein